MAAISPYLLVAWIPVVLGFFPYFRKHRAVIVAFLLGMLFLPEVGSLGGASSGVSPVQIGVLHFPKDNAISYALLFAVLAYDWQRLLSLKPRWFDAPMLVWCLCPFASVLANEPPPDGSWVVRDGLAQTLQQTVTWGIPYVLGRLYFTDPRALRDLAVGIVLAAVAYVPLCLIELRLSPQLHRFAYGFSQHSFGQTVRFGGYRPMVFFKHGLTLAMWMVTALLIAAWLWSTRERSPLADRRAGFPGPLGWLVLLLLVIAVLLKSTGALVLGAAGWGVLGLMRIWPSRAWLIVLAAVAPLYIAVRTSGAWTGENVVELVRENLGEDRARSLEFRFQNEEQLIQRALKQPVLGWGGWGRARIYDEEGRDTTVTDGLWIIALGDRGFLGLTALWAALLLPALRFLILFGPEKWSRPTVAPAAVFAVIVVLWSIDLLLNAGFNHLYVVMAGAIAGLDPARFGGPAPPRQEVTVRRAPVRGRAPAGVA